MTVTITAVYNGAHMHINVTTLYYVVTVLNTKLSN